MASKGQMRLKSDRTNFYKILHIVLLYLVKILHALPCHHFYVAGYTMRCLLPVGDVRVK